MTATTTPIRTSDLIGPALDWAVAKCEGVAVWNDYGKRLLTYEDRIWRPSTSWAQAGPIIKREMRDGTTFGAMYYDIGAGQSGAGLHGPTPLIAAMRCFVASKLGDVVEIPNELLPKE